MVTEPLACRASSHSGRKTEEYECKWQGGRILKVMKVRGSLLCWALVSAAAAGQTLNCNLQGYKSVEGLKAEANARAATLTWSGESGQQLRAQFTIRDGQPIVQELAARPRVVSGSS
jgi:hypothetical protein